MNRKQRRAEKRGRRSPSAMVAEIGPRLQEAARLREANQFRDAAKIYESILQMAPDHAETLHQFGAMAIMAGETDLAVDLIGRAAAAADGVQYLPDLGYALALAGRYDAALDAYRRVIEADPENADAYYNMGNLLNAVERREEALDAFRRAIALAPDFVDAHANLGGVLHLSKRYAEAAEAYDRALAILPESADLHYNLGAAYHAMDRLDAAAEAYRRAVAHGPDRVEFQEKLGATLLELRHFDEAVTVLRGAVGRASDFVDARTGLAEALIGLGDPREAIAVCDAYLQTHGYNSGVVAGKALAHNECGEDDKSRYFLDLVRFIQPAAVAPPVGYGSLDAFNAAIEAAARAHPSLTFEPPAVATASGYQTGDLLGSPAPVFASLAGVIDRAVRDYIDGLPDEPSHPFIANAPARWTLNGWTVILQAQGHQRAHIHPSGWLSGVYYVKVPNAIGVASQDGWIEFGRPPDTIACRRETETRQIEPEAGKMLLFPSYLYHRTIPFEDDENRISFAFDVVARD